jgi:hypothetical protein
VGTIATQRGGGNLTQRLAIAQELCAAGAAGPVPSRPSGAGLERGRIADSGGDAFPHVIRLRSRFRDSKYFSFREPPITGLGTSILNRSEPAGAPEARTESVDPRNIDSGHSRRKGLRRHHSHRLLTMVGLRSGFHTFGDRFHAADLHGLGPAAVGEFSGSRQRSLRGVSGARISYQGFPLAGALGILPPISPFAASRRV